MSSGRTKNTKNLTISLSTYYIPTVPQKDYMRNWIGFCFLMDTVSLYIAQAGILMPLPLECWDYGHAQPYLVLVRFLDG
jgi:hypothetical protein